MRTSLRKELMASFTRLFEQRFPVFKCNEPKAGKLICQWQVAVDLTFFVMLQTFDDYDQFTIEIAWSEDTSFPWHSLGKVDIEGKQGRERLAQLWATGSREPVWDLAPEKTTAIQAYLDAPPGQPFPYPPDPPAEQLLPHVQVLVKDAVEKLIQYGVPLLRRVAERKGLKWPLQPLII